MGVFEKLLSVARRPVPAPSNQVKVKEASSHRTKPGEMPATEEELLAALDLAFRERTAAIDTINSAGERREELLMQPGSDEAIALIGREVDAAQLLLERLDRLEPELEYRLKIVQDQRRIDRWCELRDAYIVAGLTHVTALRAVRFDLSARDAAWAALQAEYPAARAILPRFYSPDCGSKADELSAALDEFHLVQFDPNAHRRKVWTNPTLAQIQAEGTPEEIARAEAAFGGAPLIPLPKRRVMFNRTSCVVGRWHEAGTTAELDGEAAGAEVSAGRAVFLDEDRVV